MWGCLNIFMIWTSLKIFFKFSSSSCVLSTIFIATWKIEFLMIRKLKRLCYYHGILNCISCKSCKNCRWIWPFPHKSFYSQTAGASDCILLLWQLIPAHVTNTSTTKSHGYSIRCRYKSWHQEICQFHPSQEENHANHKRIQKDY